MPKKSKAAPHVIPPIAPPPAVGMIPTPPARHSTQKQVADALKALGPSTIRMLAAEVECVVYKNGTASNDATAAELAQHMAHHPIHARRASALLRRASADPERYGAAVAIIEGIRHVGAYQGGSWTILPVEGRVVLTRPGHPTWHVEYSTDPRIGIIALSDPAAETAVTLDRVGLPQAATEAIMAMLARPEPRPKR